MQSHPLAELLVAVLRSSPTDTKLLDIYLTPNGLCGIAVRAAGTIISCERSISWQCGFRASRAPNTRCLTSGRSCRPSGINPMDDQLARLMADAEANLRYALLALDRVQTRPDAARAIALLSRTMATSAHLEPRPRLTALLGATNFAETLIDG